MYMIWTDPQTDRQANRHTNGWMDRQADGMKDEDRTDKQTDTPTKKQSGLFVQVLLCFLSVAAKSVGTTDVLVPAP